MRMNEGTLPPHPHTHTQERWRPDGMAVKSNILLTCFSSYHYLEQKNHLLIVYL